MSLSPSFFPPHWPPKWSRQSLFRAKQISYFLQEVKGQTWFLNPLLNTQSVSAGTEDTSQRLVQQALGTKEQETEVESFPLAYSQTVTHWPAVRLRFSVSRESFDAIATTSSKRLLRTAQGLGQTVRWVSTSRPVPKALILILYADLLPQQMSISCFKRKPRPARETRPQSTENQYREKIILPHTPGKLCYSQGNMWSAQGNEKSVRTVLGISSQGSLLMISRNTFY